MLEIGHVVSSNEDMLWVVARFCCRSWVVTFGVVRCVYLRNGIEFILDLAWFWVLDVVWVRGLPKMTMGTCPWSGSFLVLISWFHGHWNKRRVRY